MPSNDTTNESGDPLDRFLIAGPPNATPGNIAGIDAFLASPPVPAEPAPPAPAATPQAVVAHHAPPVPTEAATIEPHQFPAESIEAADLPILEAFPPQTTAPPSVAETFGDAIPSLISPPTFDFAGKVDPSPESSLAPDLAVGVEQGGGADVLSALAANPLDDQMLADPSTLLSAAPWSNSAVQVKPRSEQIDAWSSDASSPYRPASPSWNDSSGTGVGSTAQGGGASWERADDRSSSGSDAMDRLESRLSRAVTQLEEAVSALSAAGPAPLGSRPRGFKGRIDA